MTRPLVLITRPRAQAQALAERLSAAGWTPLIWPLLEIEATAPPPDPAGYQAILLTSANAARLCRVAPVPVLCVGDSTAQAAREAGFDRVISAQGDVDALARLARARLSPDDGPLLHPGGEDLAGDLSGALCGDGFTVRTARLYRARYAGPPEAGVAAALRRGAVALAAFYSPRSSGFFAGAAESLGADLRATLALAISHAAADPLAACGFSAVSVAESPSAEAMLRAIARLRPDEASSSP